MYADSSSLIIAYSIPSSSEINAKLKADFEGNVLPLIPVFVGVSLIGFILNRIL